MCPTDKILKVTTLVTYRGFIWLSHQLGLLGSGVVSGFMPECPKGPSNKLIEYDKWDHWGTSRSIELNHMWMTIEEGEWNPNFKSWSLKLKVDLWSVEKFLSFDRNARQKRKRKRIADTILLELICNCRHWRKVENFQKLRSEKDIQKKL